MQYLDYEKLEVYQAAMELVLTIEEIAVRLPIGRAYLIDQVRRSSTSVVLNIAEGAGEHAAQEKSRFYRMAKRSAIECASAVEIGLRLGLVENGQYKKARELVVRIAAMLTKLIQAKPGIPVKIPDLTVTNPSSGPIGA